MTDNPVPREAGVHVEAALLLLSPLEVFLDPAPGDKRTYQPLFVRFFVSDRATAMILDNRSGRREIVLRTEGP
jgi:hypothetical protein